MDYETAKESTRLNAAGYSLRPVHIVHIYMIDRLA